MKWITSAIGIIFVFSAIGMIITIPDNVSALPSANEVRVNGDVELAAEADSGSGTFDDPYIITGRTVDAYGLGYGIYIGNTTLHWSIEDSTVNHTTTESWWWDSGAGIHIQNSQNGNITGCRINQTAGYGILISNSSVNINITNNVIWGIGYRGISIYASDYNIISNNTISGNQSANFGIVFDNISDHQYVSNNTIYDVNYAGIAFNDSWYIEILDNTIIGNATLGPDLAITPGYGIATYNSGYIDIETNSLLNCSVGIAVAGSHALDTFDALVDSNTIDGVVMGIYTAYGTNLTISNNDIDNTVAVFSGEVTDGIRINTNTNNTTVTGNYINDFQTGINITVNCSNVTIYLNHLTDNVFNAWDENNDTAVSWDNSYTGNWWDDWTSPDTNNNGIVDNPRLINGGGGNYDYYPRTTITIPGTGYVAPVPAPEIIEIIETAETTEEAGLDIHLGWLFYIGGIMVLLGLAKFPIPYVQPLWLKVGGAFLIVLNFLM